jgi:uncharacterized membrane protein YbhN (UPF0104 family)
VRRLLLNLAKLGISMGLLAYLVAEVRRTDPATFERLWQVAPHGPTLLLGWACLIGSLAAGVLRWHAVLAALGVSTPLGRLYRCAIYGFALDFAALGTAGGDVVKGVMLARDHPRQRSLVLVSVIIDRIVGLYTLVTLCALVLFASDPPGAELQAIRIFLVTVALALNLVLALLWLVPGVGRAIERRSGLFGRYSESLVNVIRALRGIRDHPPSILPVMLINIVALICLVSGCSLVAASLPGEVPTYAEQWRIVPIAMLSSLLPLPGGTLGALDYAMSFLYQQVTAGRVALGQGLLVVMMSRGVSVIVSSIAVAFYLRSRLGRTL